MKGLKRVFHHHDKWEDAAHGMWARNTSGEARAEYRRRAAALMASPEAFYRAMERVTREWPYSCEANLTAKPINKRAWLGHAGTCLVTGSPEDVTREAWHMLSQTQQDQANAAADRAISEWETRYVASLEPANAKA